MTPERFREVRPALGLSYTDLAGLLGCDDRLVRRWASGAVPIPIEVSTWLEALAAVWEARPDARPEWFQKPGRAA